MGDVIKVVPLRPLHDWFMRKANFDGEDAILISALIESGILEYAAPSAPRPTCAECGATRPCATHDTPRPIAAAPAAGDARGESGGEP